jgi:hypothetical protein
MLIAVLAMNSRGLAFASLYFPVYYMAASWWVSLRGRPLPHGRGSV